jgi:lycopene cyclase domain-containing protein
MSHLLYLALLVGCLFGTAPLELLLGTRVYARWRRLLLALAPTVVLFTLWDLYAISRDQWTYDRHWVTGLRLPGDLPVEELLFFAIVPTCAVLTLEAVRRCRPTWVIGDEATGRRTSR